jgi:hypothetical protein
MTGGMCRGRLFFVVAAVFFVVAWSLPAPAYRPSASSVLNRAMERAVERGTKVLKVETIVQEFTGEGAPNVEPVNERLVLAAPGQLRRETEGDKGNTVEVRDGLRTVVRAPGQPDKSSKAAFDLLLLMVGAWPPASAMAEQAFANVQALGVNPEVTSFSRFDGRVAIVLGSKPWEVDKPQVWFDKDTLLPVRVVTFPRGADGLPVRLDVRYLGWGSPVGGNWYPASIEVWRADKLVRRSVTQTVDRNGPVEPSFFQLR